MIETIWLISIVILTLYISIPTIYGFLTGAPILYSPEKSIMQSLEATNAKPGEKFFDLGMGNGKVLVVAVKEFDLAVSGFELSPLIYLLARINLFFHGIKSSGLYLRNFYKQDLSSADIIFCFLTPPAMEKLRPKFERELRPGTRIISYAFRIHGWTADQILDSDNPGKIYIYTKK